jgi:hypothetical protein
MAISSFADNTGLRQVGKLEDADSDAIFAALQQLHSAGVSCVSVINIADRILVYECRQCKKLWINDTLHKIPRWNISRAGHKGRPINVDEILTALALWDSDALYCEPCLLDIIAPFLAREVLDTLKNKNLKKFFRVFVQRLEIESSNFKSDNPKQQVKYRFYVKFVEKMIKDLPPRYRTACKDLTRAMVILGLIQ